MPGGFDVRSMLRTRGSRIAVPAGHSDDKAAAAAGQAHPGPRQTTRTFPHAPPDGVGNAGSALRASRSTIHSKPSEVVGMSIGNFSGPHWSLAAFTQEQAALAYEAKLGVDRTVLYPFTLTFVNNEYEVEYRKFFLNRALTTWRRALSFNFVVCSALYFYAFLAFRHMSEQWKLEYSDEAKARQGNPRETFHCPGGWWCADCDPNGFCGEYRWASDVVFYIIGVVVPMSTAYCLTTRLSRDSLAYWIQTISTCLSIKCLTIGLIVRFVVVEPQTSVYTSGLILIEFMFLTHIFMRFRFIYAAGSVTTCFLMYVILNVWNSFSNQWADIKALAIVCIALFASGSVMCMYNYEWEITSRNQFLAALKLHRANVKLANQLQVLQKSYGNRAADFDSPLEKAVMILRSMLADPNVVPSHISLLAQAVTLLSSSNLLVPDLENQEVRMDNEQEAWLFSEIARRKNRPRTVGRQRGSMALHQAAIAGGRSADHLGRTETKSTIAAGPLEGGGGAPTGSIVQSLVIHAEEESGRLPGRTVSAKTFGQAGEAAAASENSTVAPPTPEQLKTPPTLGSLPHTSREVEELLLRTCEYNFPIFDLARLTGNQPLSAMAHHVFEKSGLFKTFWLPQEVFTRFIVRIENGYHKDLPYHNSLHAADVLHATSHFCTLEPLKEIVTRLEVMAIYLGAIVHDYDHPGFTNNFLIQVGDPKAILYNDRAVLENHHLASSFAILTQPEYNFLSLLSKADFKTVRETMVETVLATDLSQHFVLINQFKNKIAAIETFDPQENKEDRILLFKMVMKCADVSNPTKDISLYKEWSGRVLEEMLRQGDKEKSLSLPVSPFMDRETLNVPSSQTGFIEFVVFPLYDSFNKYVSAEHALEGLERSRGYWQAEKERELKEKESRESREPRETREPRESREPKEREAAPPK